MDYQKTLNLPQTDFAMRAGLAQKEPLILKKWEEEGLYARIVAQAKGQTPFILHDGPPYANGHIHIGHALNKILKDFIVKMKAMQGHEARYIPGWDCHGLPIEHQLFKDLNKRKSEVDTLEFRRQAHDYALKFVDIQKDEFKRLGVFGEWDRPYLTLATDYERWILNAFARLVRAGYVYRGLKPVNWCGQCETALAEAEVEYEDHTSPSVFVRFRVSNPQALSGLPSGKPLQLVIWTTTPWTLLANVAVAVHHAFTYALVETPQDVLILEKSLVDKVLSIGGLEGKVIREISGAELCVLNYVHPFHAAKTDRRVIAVDYVTREDGTGLVHTAPGHGQEDYEAGLKNGLEIVMPVNDRGVFTEEGGAFAGQHVFKANEAIIEDLRARGLLLASQAIQHSYPHCWRCKKAVIFRATQQWFLSIDHQDLRARLKDVIRTRVQWIPAAGQERILGMVLGRPDWCLSRQRHWGVPIPALICAGCHDEHKLFPEVVERFAEMAGREGTDVWFAKDLPELLPPGFRCPQCGGADFRKTHDILDVWFDSGVSHQAVVGPMLGQKIPVDLYLEGSDQHRGWFQSSLIPAVALEGQAPFKAVLTHGFVVDGQGRKMSKSLGNVIAPQDVVKNNGVDILRMWVASSNYSEDIRLSKEILDRLVDAYRKIRNTVRYLLGNLSGFDPARDTLAFDALEPLDQWALGRLHRLAGEVREAYNGYEFARVYKAIYAFCNEDLSSFYLDILKDRLYTSSAQAPERRSAQTVLYHILNHLVRLLAPMIPFTAEEIYASMPKEAASASVPSVHLLRWLDPDPLWAREDIARRFAPLLELRPFVSKALEDRRQQGEIGSSLEAKVTFQSASARDLEFLRDMRGLLPAVFIVSQVDVEDVPEVNNGLGGSFPATAVKIGRAEGQKCGRCWNYRDSVGQDTEHPLLCDRCGKIVRAMI